MTGEHLHGPLAQLYDVLARIAPTTGVLVARAVALAENCEADAALSQLDAITGAEAYQPWWAARARILWLCGQEAAAREAASRAAGLSSETQLHRPWLWEGLHFSTVRCPPSMKVTAPPRPLSLPYIEGGLAALLGRTGMLQRTAALAECVLIDSAWCSDRRRPHRQSPRQCLI
jgi:hypothetical protein